MIDRSPHYLLNSIAGWRAASLTHATTGGGCLQLARTSSVPFPLADIAPPPGTLGGLIHATGIAADAQGRVYILDAASCTLKRYNRCLQQFIQLPCIGPQGCEPRQLNSPNGLAISCSGNLYIADTGNHRVQVFSLQGLALRRIWGPLEVVEAEGQLTVRPAVPKQSEPAATGDCPPPLLYPSGTWQPWDVAVTSRGWAYVSDYANGLIHVFDPRGCWHSALTGEGPHTPRLSKPTRVAVDREGRIFVVQQGSNSVVILSPEGQFLGSITSPDDVPGPFCPVAVTIDVSGNLCVCDLASQCTHVYQLPATGSPRFCQCLPGCFATALVFDSSGNAIFSDGKQLLCQPAASSFALTGTFVSSALDSKTYRCVWHRVALTGAVPSGTAVRVDTFTSESPKTDDEILSLAATRWSTGQIHTASDSGEWDCLIQAPAGRYLWLRLTLTSDGTATPSLARTRVYYPRNSSLRYLPATYRADTTSADFLDRFLSIFDSLRGPLSSQITDMAALFDPMATPSGATPQSDFLSWLASWLGISFKSSWPLARRRQLVRQAHTLFRLRGTPAGLSLHVQLYAGVQPRILELFRLRRWLFVNGASLGNDTTLFGNSVMNRLQLDVHSSVGSFQLIDYGDPSLDLFNQYAHRFLVVVPRWPGSGQADEQALQQIIELAKPAHTVAQLQWAEPRLRIGLQSFIGVDSVIAAYPSGVIEGQGKLGHDTVLSGSTAHGSPSMQVGLRSVIGCNASLQ
jgi:phage tail-like protein